MPLHKDSPSANRILDFYAGRAPDDRGRWLATILAWDDAYLEEVHDYIQWLFPLPEPSAFQPEAPLLDAKTISVFRADATLQEKLRASFLRMLSFYGLRPDEGAVVRAEDFRERSYNWLQPGNHNHLRLTRILRSLCLLGLEREALALFACLRSIYQEEEATARPRISARTFRFWREAVEKSGLKSC